MHVHSFHSFHELHIAEIGRKVIEQYALTTLILALAIMLGTVYALNSQSSRAELPGFTDISGAEMRLSRFANPQYASETGAREQMIRTMLDRLRRNFQADRAYLAVYGRIEEPWYEYQVISILEATRAGVAPGLERLQGIGRSAWLQMEDNASRVSWPLAENEPEICGMELYDAQGTPVGYLGLESIHAHRLTVRDFQLLSQSARALEAAMSLPLDRSDRLKELWH